MATATLETPATQSRPSLVDELHRIADWIREHDAAQDVFMVVFPPRSAPDKPFRVVFHQVEDLTRLLAGAKATRTRRRDCTDFRATSDGITFEATKYGSSDPLPVVEEVTL